jgi:hypothetical protein
LLANPQSAQASNIVISPVELHQQQSAFLWCSG